MLSEAHRFGLTTIELHSRDGTKKNGHAMHGRAHRTGSATRVNHFTGTRTGALIFFKSTTMNFAGCVLLAFRPISWTSSGLS